MSYKIEFKILCGRDLCTKIGIKLQTKQFFLGSSEKFVGSFRHG